MARRDKSNAHRSGSATAESDASRAEIERLKAKLRQVEGERDALRAELAASQIANAELERSRDSVVERIDRVVGSLEGLLAEV